MHQSVCDEPEFSENGLQHQCVCEASKLTLCIVLLFVVIPAQMQGGVRASF